MGAYDKTMKSVVAAGPQELAEFIWSQLRLKKGIKIPEKIQVIDQLNTEFEGYKVEADGLLHLVTDEEEEILLHIEFQRKRDTNMPDRQLEYCFRARQKHGPKPVVSCVIYLRPDGNMQEPPLCWEMRSGHKLLAFDYISIKLWEFTREDLLAFDRPALLPLTLLTKGGANCRIVEEVFQGLLDNRLRDLLPAVNMLAEQVLGKGDLEWLKRRYKQMTDLFHDTWTFQTMQQEAREEAKQEVQKAEQEAKQKAQKEVQEAKQEAQKKLRQGLEQATLALISGRFPKLVRLTKKLIKTPQSADHLQQLLINLSAARDETEAEDSLLLLGDEEASRLLQEEVG